MKSILIAAAIVALLPIRSFAVDCNAYENSTPQVSLNLKATGSINAGTGQVQALFAGESKHYKVETQVTDSSAGAKSNWVSISITDKASGMVFKSYGAFTLDHGFTASINDTLFVNCADFKDLSTKY